MNLYDFYKNPEELNGHKDKLYHVPKLAYEALEDNINREDRDKLENAICKDSKYSLQYALLSNKAFPKGEEAISKDAQKSMQYALEILKSPFPKGEEAIAKNAQYSFEYAKYVLKKAFPKGEAAIAKNHWQSIMYQQFLAGLK